MMLSILIPTLPERHIMFTQLLAELNKQIYDANLTKQIQIISDNRTKEISIGQKRNSLLMCASGKYLCFIDCDDWIAENYITEIFCALQNDPDCLSLRGILTTNGENPENFEHSIRYDKWETTNRDIKYLRMPNHLNVIRSSIAKQIKYPHISMGEDHAYSIMLQQSGLLKNEFYINQVLYYYRYITK